MPQPKTERAVTSDWYDAVLLDLLKTAEALGLAVPPHADRGNGHDHEEPTVCRLPAGTVNLPAWPLAVEHRGG